MANVTVSAASADFTDSEVLRVGFWVGSATPSNLSVSRLVADIATNPVEPYVYVTDNGNSIARYNVYNGKLVGTFPNVAPSLGALAVSSDGLTLFAYDITDQKIIFLKANTGQQISSFTLRNPLSSNMVYARLSGRAVLFASDGPVIDVDTRVALAKDGSPLFNTSFPPAPLAATPDGSKLIALTNGGELIHYALSVSNNNVIVNDGPISFTGGGNCQAVAVSHEGKRVYTACGAPYEFDVYDGNTLAFVQALPANPYPNNAVVDENNTFVGGTTGDIGDYTIYVYSNTGFSRGNAKPFGYQASGYTRVSGDATRVISVAAGVNFGNMP